MAEPFEIVIGSNMDAFGKQVSTVPIGQLMEKELQALAPVIVNNLRRLTPKGATGQLAASTNWKLVMTYGAEEAIGTLYINQDAVSQRYPKSQSPPAVYAPYVSKGTRPHMPPSQALELWAFVKLGVAIDVAPRVAFAVARKIRSMGTRPNPYTLHAVEQSMPAIQQASTNMGKEIHIHLLDFEKSPLRTS